MYASPVPSFRAVLKLSSAIGVGVFAFVGAAGAAEAIKKDEVFKPTTAVQVPGKPLVSFDISWFDRVTNLYYLADRSNKAIEVINPADNSITQYVNNGYAGLVIQNGKANNDVSGPDGVATVNNHTEVWVGDSPGKVWVQDSKTLAVKSLPGGASNPILVGGTSRADEFCYDTRNHRVMITSPAESPPYVSFISTDTYKVVGQLIFDGAATPPTTIGGIQVAHAPQIATNGLEQCQYSAETGKLYQNVPEVNGPGDDTAPGGIAVINGKTMLEERFFPIPLEACAGPQGMTIGPHNQILEGCSAPSPNGHDNVAVVNIHSGAILASLPDIGGADEVWYNPGDGHYFVPGCNAACRQKLTDPTQQALQTEQLAVVDAFGLRLDQSAKIPAPNVGNTGRRVHSVAVDPLTNQVFVPIPAIPVAPTMASVCSSAPNKVGAPTDTTGCIAVFTTTHDDRPRLVRERDRDDEQD